MIAKMNEQVTIIYTCHVTYMHTYTHIRLSHRDHDVVHHYHSFICMIVRTVQIIQSSTPFIHHVISECTHIIVALLSRRRRRHIIHAYGLGWVENNDDNGDDDYCCLQPFFFFEFGPFFASVNASYTTSIL